MRSEQGYSLTELIVVIGLIAVITAIAVPAFNRYSANANLRTAARDVASDLFTMRERAAAENRQFMVQFSVGGNSYTLNQGTSSGAPWTSIQTKSLTAVASDIRMTNVTFTNQLVAFSTRGNSLQAGSISLTNKNNSIATITVNFAGRTHVSFTW